jgi:hypothetical protein
MKISKHGANSFSPSLTLSSKSSKIINDNTLCQGKTLNPFACAWNKWNKHFAWFEPKLNWRFIIDSCTYHNFWPKYTKWNMKYIFFEPLHEELSNFMSKFPISSMVLPFQITIMQTWMWFGSSNLFTIYAYVNRFEDKTFKRWNFPILKFSLEKTLGVFASLNPTWMGTTPWTCLPFVQAKTQGWRYDQQIIWLLKGKFYAWSPHPLLNIALMNNLSCIGSFDLFVVSLRMFF